MSEESSLEAVRELEQRISDRLVRLAQADGPVHRARREAEELLAAAGRDADEAARRIAVESAEQVEAQRARIHQDVERRIALLRQHVGTTRDADLALVRDAVLPGEATLASGSGGS